MRATKDFTVCLDAVADDTAVTMRALGRHGVNGALKTIERHCPVALYDPQGLVVVISADVTFRHGTLLNLLDRSATAGHEISSRNGEAHRRSLGWWKNILTSPLCSE
jgi:hypothetical protein